MYTYVKHIYAKLRHSLLSVLVDAYVVSFPKSGRTWLRYFLASYFHEKYNCKHTLEFSAIIRSTSSTPRIIFTHKSHKAKDEKGFKKGLKELKKQNIIFLVRDPRDIIVSHYYHLYYRESDPEVQSMSKSDFIRHEKFGIKHLICYLNFFSRNREMFNTFYLLRYEDMKNNTKETFASVLRFLGEEDIDDEVFNTAIEASSFDNMQNIEKETSIDNKRLQPIDVSKPQSYKVRRGKIGGFKEELSDEDVAYLNNAIKELDSQFGYSIN